MIGKPELIENILGKNEQWHMREVSCAVNMILEVITKALADGRRVEFRGFGSFHTERRMQKHRQNPKTLEQLPCQELTYIKFKAGTELRTRVNACMVPQK